MTFQINLSPDVQRAVDELPWPESEFWLTTEELLATAPLCRPLSSEWELAPSPLALELTNHWYRVKCDDYGDHRYVYRLMCGWLPNYITLYEVPQSGPNTYVGTVEVFRFEK